MKLFDTNLISAFLHREAPTRRPKLHAFVASTILREGLSMSFVTQYEVRRGLEDLARKGEGRRLRVSFEKLLARVDLLGLDTAGGRGWDVAARLWAEGRALKPALVLSEGDLLVAATAVTHERTLFTADRGLREGLARLSLPIAVEWVPPE